MQKFKGKLTCGFKKDIRNLVYVYASSRKSENFWLGTLMSSFSPKHIKFQLKKYRGVMSHDSEEWCKIWWGTDLCFEKWRWGIWWIMT